jgi:LmbE family N-acetylglucosaminyl deacetylase
MATMTSRPGTLMAVVAHPDDESLGFGGTLALYASAGVVTALVTATRGDRGRYGHARPGDAAHPGAVALGRVRESELLAAAATLGVHDVSVLSYDDQQVDQAEPGRVIGDIARQIRRVRPDVVVTFGPDGAYGHPDHIAVSQFTSAAIVAAADAACLLSLGDRCLQPHAVSKLYFLAWPASTWDAYQQAFKTLVSVVDGVERHAVPWPDWAITSTVDTRRVAATVWRAVQCHTSQISAFDRLRTLPDGELNALWERQCFYRAFSSVNGGRSRETDLFEGIP